MLKIRLMRIGAKKTPFYRVVAVDERSKRTGGYIELLGTYNPLTEPKDIKLKQDRIDYWIKQGAQPSTGFLRIIGKAPQRPPRKPKKQATGNSEQAETKTEEAAKTEELKVTEPSTETPAEAPVAEAPAAESTPAEETEGAQEQPATETTQPEEVENTPTTTAEEAPAEPTTPEEPAATESEQTESADKQNEENENK